MDSATGELPPRPPPQKRTIWRLQPAPQTEESWGTLAKHARNIEIAVVLLCIVSLPFTIIAGLPYRRILIGGIIATVFTILSSGISLWAFARSKLSATTSLIRAVIFLIAWLITSSSARSSYYYYDYDDDDNDFDDIRVNVDTRWSVIVRSVFYWGLCVTFFIYLITSGMALHRHRNKRRMETYRMHGAPQYYAHPPPGQHGAPQYGPPPSYPPHGAQYGPPPGPPPATYERAA